MTAEEFVSRLKDLTPSVETLASEGISPETIAIIREARMIKEKGTQSLHHNPLKRLIDFYDCSKAYIGMVRFAERLETINNLTTIGTVEVDPLVIDDITDEVFVMEAYEDNVLWYCAASEAQFLDAIYRVASFLAQRPDLDDREGRRSAAIDATILAGGDRYADFYHMLLCSD